MEMGFFNGMMVEEMGNGRCMAISVGGNVNKYVGIGGSVVGTQLKEKQKTQSSNQNYGQLARVNMPTAWVCLSENLVVARASWGSTLGPIMIKSGS